ncbi:uncharacterized protein LOC110707910 [Chenopodium quinoa]|uniref:uncharacterized protein LOC110707910 n=1 Tax=Chenopodium quinoa TaxID=63459 RepID=UPI000B783EAD|nr:uncharacterized protein LOC110707910 [Chenopodium quinoa]
MEVTVGTLIKVGATVAGGMLALSLATSTTIKVIHFATEAKRKSEAKPCLGCKGKGFYICKLCKGNATIQWSPLYDPIHINPCQCPTCDGHCIQRCLNCIGKGYY